MEPGPPITAVRATCAIGGFVPAFAVIGAQWGDEGKGKIIDFLARDAVAVARYSGGNYAGHTVWNEHG